MLISITPTSDVSRSARRERGLQYDGLLRTPSIGCAQCSDLSMCGGLRIKQAVFDCLRFCCKNPSQCDTVCRNNPEAFVTRVREVGGFGLSNVPALRMNVAPELPAVVPVIYHRVGRNEAFTASNVVALPLYKAIGRHSGQPRYKNRKELSEGFGISETATVLLSGCGRDAPLERWWSLGIRRIDAIRSLRDLGVQMVTTPNYSLFTDQPRWDDLHSMKRIALTHEEFLKEGMPAALHLNARTDRDWVRWAEYIAARPEVTHVAFEFATGAGTSGRIGWHADQLTKLAARVVRPLQLVMRGGSRVVLALQEAFNGVTVLETSPFMKTMYRQQIAIGPDGKLVATTLAMERSESLDALLQQNWRAISGRKDASTEDGEVVH